MIIRRRWLDADGLPRTELATWLPAPEGDERGAVLTLPDGLELIDGTPDELAGPLMLVALADPAATEADAGAFSLGLYEAPLREGATLATAEEHTAAVETETAANEGARQEVTAQLAAQKAERQAPRLAALAKLAEAANLTDDERAALLGGS